MPFAVFRRSGLAFTQSSALRHSAAMSSAGNASLNSATFAGRRSQVFRSPTVGNVISGAAAGPDGGVFAASGQASAEAEALGAGAGAGAGVSPKSAVVRR